jgi:hypothetical protein
MWAAIAVSSQPMIVRSAGTVNPRCLAACYTPAAISSLEAKIAVGGGTRSSS